MTFTPAINNIRCNLHRAHSSFQAFSYVVPTDVRQSLWFRRAHPPFFTPLSRMGSYQRATTILVITLWYYARAERVGRHGAWIQRQAGVSLPAVPGAKRCATLNKRLNYRQPASRQAYQCPPKVLTKIAHVTRTAPPEAPTSAPQQGGTSDSCEARCRCDLTLHMRVMSGSVDDAFAILQRLSLPDGQPFFAGTTNATAYHGTSRLSPIGTGGWNATVKCTITARV